MAGMDRKKRIEELIQRELGSIFLKHPNREVFTKVTITLVMVAADLATAKIFYSVFDGVDLKVTKELLEKNAAFFRKSLAHDLNLRSTPKLNFIYDESIKRGRELSNLIDAAVAADEKNHTDENE